MSTGSPDKACCYKDECLGLPPELLETCNTKECGTYLHHACHVSYVHIHDPGDKLPMSKKCIDCVKRAMNSIKPACAQMTPTLPTMMLKPATPPLPEMCDFTLIGTTVGTTVGAPDIDSHAPTDVAVATDGEMPIVEINVSGIATGITTRSDLVIDPNRPKGNNERKKKGAQNGFARNSGLFCKDIFHHGSSHHANDFDHAYGRITSIPKKMIARGDFM